MCARSKNFGQNKATLPLGAEITKKKNACVHTHTQNATFLKAKRHVSEGNTGLGQNSNRFHLQLLNY